ncbi:MAG TPA: D-glycerate dehydrogenase [Gemmatimonadaceae bacterium]
MTGGRVFVTRRLPQVAFDMLREAGVAVSVGQLQEECAVPRELVMAGVRQADVLLPLLTERIDREVLEANDALLGVANYAVGYNNVDVAAATALGIPVSNTPGVLTETSADLTWALILGVARKIPQAHSYMVRGRYKLWGPNLFLGEDVSPGGSGRRKVLGIVGFGRIGRAVARRALGFDMEVLAYDPYARERIELSDHASWADLPDLLSRSDFVTLHALLTDETHHLIDEGALALMKPTAYLINVARGPVVNEAALVEALREGRIAGAALDVYEHEPDMTPGLAGLPNVLLVPHIASASRETRDRMAAMAAANALAHLRRERAPNVVNPEVYETAAYARRAG